jgi:antitoxin component YwqK of YwqJK toxin-antitoxin module
MFDSEPFTGKIHKNTHQGSCETSYLNGLKHGVEKEFYRSGVVRSVILYNLGVKDGRQIEYWPCGAKKMHISYSSGLMDGVCEEWNPDGSSKHLRTYYKGKLICIKSNPPLF